MASNSTLAYSHPWGRIVIKKHLAVCLILTFISGTGGLSVFGQVANRLSRAGAGDRGFSNNDLAYLVTNSAVVKELAISAEAYDKLVQATESLRAELRLANDDVTALERGTPEYAEGRRKLTEATKTAKAAFAIKVKEILTPEQFARVQQITYHAKGVQAFDDPEVAELLALSQEQHQQIARIKTESTRKMQGVSREGIGDVRAITSKLQDLRKESETQILGVLNSEQLELWTKVKGKDFDLTRTRGAIAAPGGNERVRGALSGTDAELESISRIGAPYSGGDRDVLSLVVNEEVAKELALTDEAANTLRKLALARNVEIREAAGDIVRPGVDRLNPEQVKTLGERSKDIRSTYVPKVKAILSEKQYTRAQQICWQASGNRVYNDPEVIQALGLTKEQQDKITTLVTESRERSFALIRSGSGYEQGAELSMLPRKIADVLTADQSTKLNTLKGEKFDLTKIRPVRSRPGRGEADQPPIDLARILYVQPDVLAIAANDAVVQELGLSKEVATQLKKLIDEKNVEVKKATDAKQAELDRADSNFQRPRGEQSFSERQREFEVIGKAIRGTYVQKIQEVMTAEQYTRLQQITWQVSGVMVLNNPDVAQLLGLTQEQKDKIARLNIESSAKLRTIRSTADDRGPGGNGRWKEAEELRNKIPEVLTAEQAAKWEALKGKPFDRSKMFGDGRTNGMP